MLLVHLDHLVNCVVDVIVLLAFLLLILWRGAMAFAPLLGAAVAWAWHRLLVTVT